ncbi:hypothetical protein J437_LFUL014512 [Ladona fulva]|uniref:COMM domain-containing protein 3 n=1 Tax=Ladona fulva TaxID=123851 RepID=A0A8K0KFX1_LADFU|nr:hypothetical protein J437_LFUL014512 [Ladona fulva]
MEISNQVSEGLKVLGSPSKIDDDLFRSYLEAAVISLSSAEKMSEIKINSTAEVDGKVAYASLLVVMVEAARHDVDSTSLASILEEKRFDPPRLDKVLKLYSVVKHKLQAQLSGIGSFPPHVVDATWKLDYVIKSDNLEYKSGPQYLVNLLTEVPGGGEKKIQFACTMEEMQDLVGKLREAAKLMEKVANV